MSWSRWVRRCGAGLLLACGCVPQALPVHPSGGTLPPGADCADGVKQAVHLEPSSRQAAVVSQQLADARDEAKVLAARLQEMQTQLDEKTKALARAQAEVHGINDEVARTRDEMDRWRHEISGLRERAHSAEKENQATLLAIAHLLEVLLEKESPPAPPRAAPAPAPPPVPAP